MERKLAAILAADIVGYSAQMERDEAGTFARVTARRKDIFEPLIASHGGRIFKTMGDGILAEFGSIVQAVECAVALQMALAERNCDVPEPDAIRARIGINLGEVIVDGDDRYGEGVNIAARLEALAEPGGICVSEKVAREVERKLAFGFEPMGAQKVKNLAEPIMTYRVTHLPMPRVQTAPDVTRRWVGICGLLTFAAIAILAILVWFQPRQISRDRPPTLAVLNFTNLTGDPERDFIAVSVLEGSTIILSTSASFGFVDFFADFGSSMSQAEVRLAASKLEVDLLLGGSFATGSDSLSFTGQLLDGVSGKVVATFTERVPNGDFAALQFALAKATMSAVVDYAGVVPVSVLDPAWSRVSAGPDEYSLFLRARAAHFRSAFSGRDDALRLLSTGLDRYPQSILLRISKASRLIEGLYDAPENKRAAIVQEAWQIVTSLPDIATMTLQERWYLAFVRAQLTPLATGDFAAAMTDAETAHAITPYLQWANLVLSDVAANAGHGARAVEWARVGMAEGRNTHDWQRSTLAWALLVAGQPEQALAEYALIRDRCLPCEVVALVRTGRLDKARSLVDDIRSNRPDMTIASENTYPTGQQPFMTEPYLSAYLDDLRKAGLPEGPPPP